MPERRSIPRVLLVTGAYYPEISAAAVQCRAVAAAIGERAELSVLTTAVNRALPRNDTVDGRHVARVLVDVASPLSKALASTGLAAHMLQASGTYDIIHVHGFSQKNVPVSILGRALGKRLVLTLHTAGQDEPDVVRRRGRVASWAFASADLTLAVSPRLLACWTAAGLPADRIRLAPNGVDTARFRPAGEAEKRDLRLSIGWPDASPVVLFVGFFSRDKRPDLLFRAWRRCVEAGVRSRLAFVGAKRSGYYEIDESIADRIGRDAAAAGLSADILFVEPGHDVERFYRAADLFVLPSVREAHPLALLEAMACGLPCIATRLAGATDALVDDGITGRLIPADDEAALAAAVGEVLRDPGAARAMGARARAAVVERFDVKRTADAWLAAYADVTADRR